jgi:hypothetical protein
MNWLHDGSYFLAGCFLTNAIPHVVSGLLGRPFQTPFAHPPGKGLSSSTTNFVWGFVNLAIGYALSCKVGRFDLQDTEQVLALGTGVFLTGLFTARMFGRFHGGNSPGKS